MTDVNKPDETRRGPASDKPVSEDEVSEPSQSKATAEKQMRMDANRAERSSGSGIVSHTVDNASAGTALAADEKAARAKVRNG